MLTFMRNKCLICCDPFGEMRLLIINLICYGINVMFRTIIH